MTIMEKSVLRSSVVKVYAKAEAKSVVKNIFTLITKRCPKYQKTLTGCVKTKNSEYRRWLFTHQRFAKEAEFQRTVPSSFWTGEVAQVKDKQKMATFR